MGWYGGGTASSNSVVSETATSTMEPKSSRSSDSRRRVLSLGWFLPSVLGWSHGCPIFSTSLLDIERDRATESDRLSLDCCASFCVLDSFGRGGGSRYPSRVRASICRCCSSFLDFAEEGSFFGRWANCRRRRWNGFRSCFGGSSFGSNLGSLGETATGSAVVVSKGLEGGRAGSDSDVSGCGGVGVEAMICAVIFCV